MNGVAVHGHDRDMLQLHEGSDPLFRPGPFRFGINAQERRECQTSRKAVSVAEIVMRPAGAEAERKHAHTLVKGKNAGVCIAAELCGQCCQQCGLARAGRPENQGVAEVAHMDVEPERRRFIRCQHSQGSGVGRIKRAGADGRTRPDRGQGQKISQVQRIDHRPPQIGVAVARMRSKPCFQGVDSFNPAAEAKRLDVPAQFPRPILELLLIFMHQHNAGSQVASPNIAAQHFGQGVFRVFGHKQRVTIGAGVGVVKKLVKKAIHLLPPPLAVGVYFLGCIVLVKADKAGGKAVLQRKRFQIREHGREGFLWQPVNGKQRKVFSAKPGNDATDQIIAGKKVIQIHGPFRYAQRVQISGNALLDMG